MAGQTSVSMSSPQAAREAEMIAAQTTIAEWIHLIRSEYLEMPGLHLTRNQVLRLWSLDASRVTRCSRRWSMCSSSGERTRARTSARTVVGVDQPGEEHDCAWHWSCDRPEWSLT
jgi:hypothetical protein